MNLIELEKELHRLKERVERLETLVAQAIQERQPSGWESFSTLDALVVDLRRRGLLIAPPPAAIASALRWQSLPPEVQEMIRQEADHLPPGPNPSELILHDRR